MSDELVRRAKVYVVHVDGQEVNLGERIEALEAERDRWKQGSKTMTEWYEHRGRLLEQQTAALAVEREKVARLVGAIKALLRRDEINTCPHHETHRGGFLWEICDSCGAKWADDEGGKPEWVEPAEWIEACAALASVDGFKFTGEKT